jgi:hypothetical protein
VLDLTPREFDAYSDGVLKRRDSETILFYKHASWTAAWSSGKKPERLEGLLYTKRMPKDMTDDEMFAQVKALHAIYGGE